MLHPIVHEVTQTVITRSLAARQKYLAGINQAKMQGKRQRSQLSCTNLAHGVASMSLDSKVVLKAIDAPNLAIVSSYNDMLSAHEPLREYPDWIKQTANSMGATAQFAGGVPAMCDGITQGQVGMELSLFSRDVIAQSTAIALSHNMFDAAIYLGVCDKIIPGLLMGALGFGHLPAIFVPAGPMSTGMSNGEKAKIRQAFAEGKIGREELLEAECQAYHSAGTCTFYGTANSNQMLMEVMGLHLPGASFVHPYTPLRKALTREAARRALCCEVSVGDMIDEKSLVNAVVGLLATGGSTNHTLHLIAIARMAGIELCWDDFDQLASVVPLITKMYPNGGADVNHFHASGGMGLVIRELLDAGLLHEDVQTIMGKGLRQYTQEPFLSDDGALLWRDAPKESLDASVLRSVHHPFSPDGGIKLVQGSLGRAIVKVSAVPSDRRVIEAPAIVFEDQHSLIDAFKRGELDRDFIAVIRYQGPCANGMPELHKLTPTLSVLQDRGFKVALVTDGRMSGASGNVLAAIHVSPEAKHGGPIAKIHTGDKIRLDAIHGVLEVLVSRDIWSKRSITFPDFASNESGYGRELFVSFREAAGSADRGAMSFNHPLFS